ncbi:16S rRNA (uracil(1498)-N(3))-methyltransferase [Mycoplasma buteonis]|uniref:16S rRNA (uracil(1498)-N(3))-methyltransferase n=1 Tax=Mycoplasma buteonis TaxID=171280 RepID=UPI0005633911|nr:16S rRNA (uracil(1498)-N(3))-methyltransferase [Mycoplasma buteonis]
MNRFFVSTKKGDFFTLNPETLKHLKVLRIQEKEFVCVYEKEFYICKLENNLAKIISKIDENHEHQYEIVLAAAIIKFERFEWLLQKATELGVTKIIPLVTEHTNHDLLKFDKFNKKRERFQTIVLNAAEQSYRNQVPEITEIMKFSDFIKQSFPNKILAHEKTNLSSSLEQPINQSSTFIVGPEGGFSESEIDLAVKNNTKIVSLGSRILRAETAGIFLLSQIKIN